MDEPALQNSFQDAHAQLLCDSFRRWMGRDLIQAGNAHIAPAEALFGAPFALVSHGTEPDPIFNYANGTALKLFEMEWSVFIRLPSRLSVEALNQTDRVVLLAQVSEQGFCDNYSGVRISATGRRFEIQAAVVWNLLDQDDQYRGQAAMFSDWCYL